MKPLIRLTICGTVLLILSISLALGDSKVRLLQVEGRTESNLPLPAVFGNREERLDLEINDESTQSGTLYADLFQVSGSLTMPITKNLHLQDAISLTSASSQPLHISLKFPEVKQRAEILVRLFLVQPTLPSTPTSLGDLRFEVFPASVTKELIDLLQPKAGGPLSVVLFGTGRKLNHFLTDLRLPFDDAGIGLPDHFERNRLYFGELTAEESLQPTQELINEARMAIFSSDKSLPWGVYAERSSSGVFIHVTLPLLDNLSDDPRAQLGLIKIIHLLAVSSSPTN